MSEDKNDQPVPDQPPSETTPAEKETTPAANENPDAAAAEGQTALKEAGDFPTPDAAANDSLNAEVVGIMKSVYDPEIPVNIYDLGMVYNIDARDTGEVLVTMTLTSPNCPVVGTLPGEVEAKVQEVESVAKARVDLVWEPPWTPEMMTEAAKLQLGFI